MNSNDIEVILKNDKRAAINFRGVYPRDRFQELLRSSGDIDGTFVFNTDPSLKGGEHWICLAIDGDTVLYFDSFGRHPKTYSLVAEALQQRCGEILWNNELLQDASTTVCGDYCVLFLLLHARGWTLQNYVDWLYALDTSEKRDHTLRRLTLSTFGRAAFSSYRNYRYTLRGVDNIHIDGVLTTLAKTCSYQ